MAVDAVSRVGLGILTHWTDAGSVVYSPDSVAGLTVRQTSAGGAFGRTGFTFSVIRVKGLCAFTPLAGAVQGSLSIGAL